jgi:hypothetical protein
MDLLDLIRTQIASLPAGVHLRGLQSVLRHIEVAYQHFSRAKKENDDSGFTDSIYRTNQAFEGSIKEAYRVLTGCDPQNMRPYDIEQYLEQKEIFGERVLARFTDYRKNWRNASTHDYNLDFSEAEAFLAIVSVSAFIKLLVDQIEQRLSHEAVRREIQTQEEPDVSGLTGANLIDRITQLFLNFARHYAATESAIPIESESQLMGALTGFLSTVAPDLQTATGRIFRSPEPRYVDMTIAKAGELVVIEVKRGKNRALLDQGLRQLEIYMDVASTQNGILFLYSHSTTDYIAETYESPMSSKLIQVVRADPHSAA